MKNSSRHFESFDDAFDFVQMHFNKGKGSVGRRRSMIVYINGQQYKITKGKYSDDLSAHLIG